MIIRKVTYVFPEDVTTSYIHISVCVICTKLSILVNNGCTGGDSYCKKYYSEGVLVLGFSTQK